MVWSLCPVDPLPGDEKYYIFSKGTYTVGRRGCDVIVKNDKSVSRVHAEVIIDSMACFPNEKGKSGFSIKDSSKYGTFLTKKDGIKEKLHEHSTKIASLEDGDVVLFGTGSAIYKLSFVPLIFYLNSTKQDASLSDKISFFGGLCVGHLSKECTHVVINESQPINEELLEGIIADKAIVLQNWVESLAEKRITSEFPSNNSNLSVYVDGTATKIAESQTRSNFMKGYTCILDSTAKYKFEQKLPSLLRISGANVVYAEGFCSSSQAIKDEKNKLLCIVPSDSMEPLNRMDKGIPFHGLKELDAFRAMLSGHLDTSSFISAPPVVISSSCSTDETIIADSDEETLTATSEKLVSNVTNQIDETPHLQKTSPFVSPVKPTKPKLPLKKEEDSVVEHLNSDIIFSQNLIIKKIIAAPSISNDSEVPNFKLFRKKSTSSGNSFGAVIPFSKNPYSDADYENKDTRESLREEKKRKQMEAVAEDLFNNQKKRQKGVAGALQGLLYTS